MAQDDAAAAGRPGLLGHRSPSRRWHPDVWDVVGGHVEPAEGELAALRWVSAAEVRTMRLAHPTYVGLVQRLVGPAGAAD